VGVVLYSVGVGTAFITGNERGDVEIKYYVVFPRGDRLPNHRSLVRKLN
jgi:hypothetical protein